MAAFAEEAGDRFEFEPKGGVVVAWDDEQLAALAALAARQAASGARVRMLDAAGVAEVDPALTRSLAGGALYDDDCQVNPMRVVALQAAQALGAGCVVARGVEVIGAEREPDGEHPAGRIVAVRTRTSGSGGGAGAGGVGRLRVRRAVVDAAGPWSGELASRLDASLPVEPRRGHVLVTEPMRPLTTHKVYEAGYVGTIHAGSGAGGGHGSGGRRDAAVNDAGGEGRGDGAGEPVRFASVVESTVSGTVLLGSSREFAGFSPLPDQAVIAEIARRAIRMFPGLAAVRLLRTYVGFRPATPDRLPAIGWSPHVAGLLHATGHEGAGIGLSQATAELAESLLAGLAPEVPAFSPARFVVVPATP